MLTVNEVRKAIERSIRRTNTKYPNNAVAVDINSISSCQHIHVLCDTDVDIRRINAAITGVTDDLRESVIKAQGIKPDDYVIVADSFKIDSGLGSHLITVSFTYMTISDWNAYNDFR